MGIWSGGLGGGDRTESKMTEPKETDSANERDRFIAAVQEGLADAEAGLLIEDEDLTRILDEEFGPAR
jgi:predicted transcriptional regulator